MNAASVLRIPEGQWYRNPSPGMGVGVLERTYSRPLADGILETWGDVADRVAMGNALLAAPLDEDLLIAREYETLRDFIGRGVLPMSGRHLQQGDATQPLRGMEVFSNCATAATSFALFYLLLNGAGVGRDYSDSLMVVDWDRMPNVMCALDVLHPDCSREVMGTTWSLDRAKAAAQNLYGGYRVFEVPDSREGWAKAVELLETLAFERCHADTALILDFSKVRAAGAPIAGMQNKPASGPVPLIEAFQKVAAVKGQGWAPWKQAMHIDHYIADVVQIGGARRAARMSVKFWKDPGILDFAEIKNEGGLWTSNNSIGVDAEFWECARTGRWHGPSAVMDALTKDQMWAAFVFDRAIGAAYHQGTGEPGYVNLDHLHFDETGIEVFDDGEICGHSRFKLFPETLSLTKALVTAWKAMKYKVIVNPCAEIPLISLGAFCIIGDAVPFFATDDDDAERGFRALTRALIRVNTMENFYPKEVARTNRIGVGMTGVHEWAWSRFQFTWADLINERASAPFWALVERMRAAIEDEGAAYAAKLELATPHTFTTGKPSGTIAKIFGLTEGFHLPAFKRYLRWVQYDKSSGAAQIEDFRKRGYPIHWDVKDRPSVALVGFPTEPTICQLGIPDHEFMTASQATMEEQYAYLRNIEKYWLGPRGNQISYTLKFDPDAVAFEDFRATVLRFQPQVRCCSLMASTETPARLEQSKAKYGYLPEDPVTDAVFLSTVALIEACENEGFDPDTFLTSCPTGACPVL